MKLFSVIFSRGKNSHFFVIETSVKTVIFFRYFKKNMDICTLFLGIMKKRFWLIFLLFACSISIAQVPAKYWVQFSDKDDTPYSIERPEEFLSPLAIEKRAYRNIAITEQDLPVNDTYVAQVMELDTTLVLLTKSKWLNGITIYSEDSLIAEKITRLPFVVLCERTAKLKEKEDFNYPISQYSPAASSPSKMGSPKSYDYGYAYHQMDLNHAQWLHYLGASGEGMLMVVLDAGFKNADEIPHFEALRNEGRLLGVKNFVLPGKSVFTTGSHGTNVLSCIASYIQGEMIGSAPKASFYLGKTEDERSENMVEVDNWVAAVEWADSLGCDVLNSSLGYHDFDDKTQSYSYNDLNGHTCRASIAADIAASKGMLVCVSAGNEGNSKWKYITPPADAENVLTVGATDIYGNHANFSSWGPTSDGRVKPDANAVGSKTYVADISGQTIYSYGTSFSSPLLSGMVACLWQLFPEKSNLDVIKALRISGSGFFKPTEYGGYGIPDFLFAYNILNQQNSPCPVVLLTPQSVTNKSSVVVYFWSENTENIFTIETSLPSSNGNVIRKTYKVSSDFGKIKIKLPKLSKNSPRDIVDVKVIDQISHTSSDCIIGLERK